MLCVPLPSVVFSNQLKGFFGIILVTLKFLNPFGILQKSLQDKKCDTPGEHKIWKPMVLFNGVNRPVEQTCNTGWKMKNNSTTQ